MASSKSECPSCHSSRNVRLRYDGLTHFKYWCSVCRIEFEIRKIVRKPKK